LIHVVNVQVEPPYILQTAIRIALVPVLVMQQMIHVVYVPVEIPDTLPTAIRIVTVTALV